MSGCDTPHPQPGHAAMLHSAITLLKGSLRLEKGDGYIFSVARLTSQHENITVFQMCYADNWRKITNFPHWQHYGSLESTCYSQGDNSLCLSTSDSQGQRHYFSLTVHMAHLILVNTICLTLGGDFFKFGITVNLDSVINWLHFCGQRSRPHWLHIHPLLVAH